ncbi:MAG: hypothetical protein V8S27_06765 [Lachnospiraceae bacterium]
MLHMYIVLGLLIFMIAMFFTGKVPYGVTTMTCCVVLALTGVMDISGAFSGLANKTTILIASMLTVAFAFGKTSLINKSGRRWIGSRKRADWHLLSFCFS